MAEIAESQFNRRWTDFFFRFAISFCVFVENWLKFTNCSGQYHDFVLDLNGINRLHSFYLWLEKKILFKWKLISIQLFDWTDCRTIVLQFGSSMWWTYHLFHWFFPFQFLFESENSTRTFISVSCSFISLDFPTNIYFSSFVMLFNSETRKT